MFEDGDGQVAVTCPEIDYIRIESKSSPLTEINMPSGISFNLSIHPMGVTPNGGEGYLQQLSAYATVNLTFQPVLMTNRSPHWLLLMEIDDFLREPGTTTLRIESTDQLRGYAEAELEVTVLTVRLACV